MMNQTHKNMENKQLLLSPGYISGLTQADGSFFCSLILSKKHRYGIQFRPKFTITADLESKYVVNNIQSFFNCGKITVNNKNYTAEFEVVKLEELQKIIIPHFNNHPVFCAKLHAFNLFTEIVNALYHKEKRTLEGRKELLKLSLSMNFTTNRKIERINTLKALLSIDSLDTVIKENKNKNKNKIKKVKGISSPITNEFISGFIDGDGSFFISFQKDGKIKTGFNLTNDFESKPLLVNIRKKFNMIGTINKGTKNELVFTVNGLNQINNILIPFMDKYSIFTEKASHYDKFKIVSLLLKNDKPLTLESKLNIVELAYEMNKKGKHRIMGKSDYIKLLKDIIY
jgi:hypothetical protein